MSWRSLREARRYVGWALLGELALRVAGRRGGWLIGGTTAASLLFFRDPERRPTPGRDVVLSGADGAVVAIERADDAWMAAGEGVCISTFLALHDVHVTRSPVAGRIARSEAIGGGFAPALLARSAGNYRKRLAIDGENGRVVVIQKAGMIARRITSWVGVDEDVAAGQRLGLIHLGSRTDVVLARDRVEVLVRAGDRVRAGVTPIARYRAEEGTP